MATATYTVQVDWNNDGVWTGTDEDVSALVRATPGISTSRGLDQLRSISPPAAGKGSFDLDNQDNRFSPENGSSPIYGLIIPGRPVRIQATFSATTYNLFQGLLDVPQQHPEKPQKSVTFPVLGTLSRLAGLTVSTALYQNITTDVAIGHLLDAVGWPGGGARVLDTGNTTLAWWWLDNEDAFSALLALLSSEGPGSTIYEDGQGNIHFESRYYRLLTTRCTTSQATYRDSGAEPLFSEPFVYDQGLKDIINSASITFKTRSVQSLSTVWSLGSTVTLSANESRSYVTALSDPCTGAIIPASGTDYTITSGSLSSVTVDRSSGTRITITLTAGASGATVTGLQLRAQPVTVTTTSVISNMVDTSASQTAYKIRPYQFQSRSELDSVNTAQDFVNAVVAAYQNPRPIVQIPINNDNSTRFTALLARDVSDRITIVESSSSVNFDAYVNNITHRADNAGLFHVGVLGCEKVTPSAGVFILDSSTNGILDTNFLGF